MNGFRSLLESSREEMFHLDVAKIKSLWLDKTLEFKQHLFQLIMRIVSSDYARHLNHRRGFLSNAADVPYMYTHTMVSEGSLSRVFSKMEFSMPSSSDWAFSKVNIIWRTWQDSFSSPFTIPSSSKILRFQTCGCCLFTPQWFSLRTGLMEISGNLPLT